MNTWSFEIGGPIRSFLGSYVQPWKDQAKRYVAYKKYVRLLANVAGIPSELKQEDRAEISISFHWKKKAHCDGSNGFKAVEDALFHQDRRVLRGSYIVMENTGEEKAFVQVTIG